MPRPRPRTKWSPRRWVLLVGAALLVIAAVAVFVVWNESRPVDAPATDIVAVTRSDQTTSVSLSGVVSPQQQANVSFAVPGTVQRIDARVGQSVAAGEPLAAVDDRDLRNAVTLAQAQLAAARAQLQTVRDSDQATSAQVAAARAQVTSAEASLEQARDRLADATLSSPLAGVVAEVGIEVGDQVSGASALTASGGGSNPLSGLGSGLGGGLPGGLGGLGASTTGSGGSASGAHMVVVVPDAWQLEAKVGTADLPALEPGQQAVVTPTGTDTHVSAVVDTVGIVASGASGTAATFPVTLRITDSSATLFSGSDADAVVTTGTVADVLTVPGEAIWLTDGRTTVRRSDGASATVVDVTTGRRFGDRIEILSGLEEGDRVLARQSIVVSPPPRPQFGPNGTLASPGPSATPAR